MIFNQGIFVFDIILRLLRITFRTDVAWRHDINWYQYVTSQRLLALFYVICVVDETCENPYWSETGRVTWAFIPCEKSDCTNLTSLRQGLTDLYAPTDLSGLNILGSGTGEFYSRIN